MKWRAWCLLSFLLLGGCIEFLDSNEYQAYPAVVSAGAVKFRFRMYAELPTGTVRGQNVPRTMYVTGSFNQWNKKDILAEMRYHNDEFSVTLTLDPGEYQFSFVVDGEIIDDLSHYARVIEPQTHLFVSGRYTDRVGVLIVE